MSRRIQSLTLPASLQYSFQPSLSLERTPSRVQRDTSLSNSVDSEDLSILHRRSNAIRSASSIDEEIPEEIPQELPTPAPRTARNLSNSYTSSNSESDLQQAAMHPYFSSHASEQNPEPSAPESTSASSGSTTLPRRVLSHFVGSVQSLCRRPYVVRPSRVVRNSVSGTSLQAMGCLAPLEPITLEEHACCAICLEAFEVDDIVQPMMNCGHLFHRSCIAGFVDARRDALKQILFRNEALGERVRCPLCRGRLATPNIADAPHQERELVRCLDSGFSADMPDTETSHAHSHQASRRSSDMDNPLSSDLETAASHLRGHMGVVYPMSMQQSIQLVEDTFDSVQGSSPNVVDLDTLQPPDEHS